MQIVYFINELMNCWRKPFAEFIPKMFPYKFNPSHYKKSFVSKNIVKQEECNTSKINRMVYCFWTGDNDMPVNRKKAYQVLVDNCGVPVCLITKDNLKDYILDSDPLPECYPMLSDVHKADYLRTYFMHYYGGGYSDIKAATHFWNNAFDVMENNPQYLICGYRELSYLGVGNANVEDKTLKRDLWIYYKNLIGNCSYICRPNTSFTKEWLDELKRRIEVLSPVLMEHPAKDPYGRNNDYPVPWTYILGEIFHPLCLKYHSQICYDDHLRPVCRNYR